MSSAESEWPALRALGRTYLRLSLRGRASQAYAGQWAGKPAGILWLLFMYAAVGGTSISLLRMQLDLFRFGLVVHAMTFVMVGLSLTAEAGDALFNPAERDVLGHRPVSGRTLLVAKATGLLGFSLLLSFALNLVPLLVGSRMVDATAWFAPAHLVTVVLLTTFAAATVVLAYGLVARFVDRDRFDNIAAWSQVALAIGFVAASQGLSRLTTYATGPGGDVAPYLFAVPPAWFAALDAVLGGTARTPGMLALAAVGVAATAGVGAAAAGRLGFDHGDAVARLDDARGSRRTPLRPLPALRTPWLRWWLADPVERASFRLAIAYLRRDRETKLRLYPSLAVFALFPLTALANREAPGAAFVPLASVCMLGMLPGVALESLRVSSHPSAAELFAVVPLAGTGVVFEGVRKATIWFVAPGLALTAALSAALVPQGLPLAVVGVLALPTFSFLPGLFGDYLPLALPPLRGHQTRRNAALMLLSTVVLLVLLVVAWLAWRSGRLPHLLVAEAITLAVVQRTLAYVIVRRPFRAA